MSLATRITAMAQAIATEINTLRGEIPAGGGGSSKAVGALNAALSSITLASNQAFNGTVKITWQTPYKEDPADPKDIDFSGSQGILKEGVYLVSVNAAYFNSGGARCNPSIQLALDTAGGTSYTAQGPISQCGYIRSANGHNEASGHITNFLIEVGAGNTTTFETWIGNKSAVAASSFQMTAGESSISVLKIG